MAKKYSKSTIPSPTDAVSGNNKIDLEILLRDSGVAAKQFQTGKEIMLDVERVTLSDGSVIDMFHHISAKALAKK